jgi:hypothetical protein
MTPLELALGELRVPRVASTRAFSFRFDGDPRTAIVAALQAGGFFVRDREIGTVLDRRAWADLLERLEGRDPSTAPPSIVKGPLSDAFRAYVKEKEAPFDHEVLKRAPGVQLMMLERLEQVFVARIFGEVVVVGHHARAGWCAISIRALERASVDPGPVENVAKQTATSTVAAAVQSALAAFGARARIAFGTSVEDAIASWIGIPQSQPPRIGKGPSFERLESALAELDAPRAIAIAGDATTTIAWGRARDGSWSAIAIRSFGDAPLCEAFEKRESPHADRIRARLDARMPWREQTATAHIVPWWEVPLPVAAALGPDRAAWRIHDEDVTWFAVREKEEGVVHVEAFDESGGRVTV